jgi:predicted DNA-binding transcriptional regulator AlpA
MAEAVMTPRLRTIQYLANVLGISVAGAWRLLNQDPRSPRPIRVGRGSTRFDEVDIHAYVELLKQQGQETAP